jgi:hypothetical protein
VQSGHNVTLDCLGKRIYLDAATPIFSVARGASLTMQNCEFAYSPGVLLDGEVPTLLLQSVTVADDASVLVRDSSYYRACEVQHALLA